MLSGGFATALLRYHWLECATISDNEVLSMLFWSLSTKKSQLIEVSAIRDTELTLFPKYPTEIHLQIWKDIVPLNQISIVDVSSEVAPLSNLQ